MRSPLTSLMTCLLLLACNLRASPPQQAQTDGAPSAAKASLSLDSASTDHNKAVPPSSAGEKRSTAGTDGSQAAAGAGVSTPTFEEYMDLPFPAADGFDYPVGDVDGKGGYVDAATGKRFTGWYVATRFGERYSLGVHPGEDWNGIGGGNTDLGQPVRSVARGRVAFAESCGALWGNVVMVDHLVFENARRYTLRSVYVHLGSLEVKAGDLVGRRQKIGTVGQDPNGLYPAHLHLELRYNLELDPTYWPSSNDKDLAWLKVHYADPRRFIDSHRELFVPPNEPTLVLVRQESYTMRVYKSGVLAKEFAISLGQEPGQKREQGDLKTPQGMYFVVQKHQGEIPGPYGDFYGEHWIRINYPNPYDAAWGLQEKKVSAPQVARIGLKWAQRAQTPANTALGGGIGFHGWIEEWDNEESRHKSWGCVVLHLADIRSFYNMVNAGSMVVIW